MENEQDQFEIYEQNQMMLYGNQQNARSYQFEDMDPENEDYVENDLDDMDYYDGTDAEQIEQELDLQQSNLFAGNIADLESSNRLGEQFDLRNFTDQEDMDAENQFLQEQLTSFNNPTAEQLAGSNYQGMPIDQDEDHEVDRSRQSQSNRYKQVKSNKQTPESKNFNQVQKHRYGGDEGVENKENEQLSDSELKHAMNNYLAPLQIQQDGTENKIQQQNEFLKQQLLLQNQKLQKTEEKLQKKREFIQEMCTLQNDISQIKKSTIMGKPEQEQQNDAIPMSMQHEAKQSIDSGHGDLPYQQSFSGNAQDRMEQVEIENRIMKAKISEMESYINTMSTNAQSYQHGPGSQISELREMKLMFEDKLLQLQKENNEKEQFFIQMRKNQLDQKQQLDHKNQIIQEMQYQISILQKTDKDDLIGDLDELKRLGQFQRSDEKFVPLRNGQGSSLMMSENAEELDFSASNVQQDQDGQGHQIMRQNNLVSQDHQIMEQEEEQDEDCISREQSNQFASGTLGRQAPFLLDESKIQTQAQSTQQTQNQMKVSRGPPKNSMSSMVYQNRKPDPKFDTTKRSIQNPNILSPLSQSLQQESARQQEAITSNSTKCYNMNNTENLNTQQPISILITSNDSVQIKKLNERCKQLEMYCKDLIKTNKVLDLENRLCISQILNLTNQSQGGSNQLNNLVGALHLLQKGNQNTFTRQQSVKDIYKFSQR